MIEIDHKLTQVTKEFAAKQQKSIYSRETNEESQVRLQIDPSCLLDQQWFQRNSAHKIA